MKVQKFKRTDEVIWGYDGEIWEDTYKRQYNSHFKFQVLALYRKVKNYQTTVATVNQALRGEARISKTLIKKWDIELKQTKPHVAAALEAEAEEMQTIYRDIYDSAMKHTKTIVDTIPNRTNDMDALELSRAALNLATLAEKMDVMDPEKKEIIGSKELIFQMTKEEKISFILNHKSLLPEEVVSKINQILASKVDKLVPQE